MRVSTDFCPEEFNKRKKELLEKKYGPKKTVKPRPPKEPLPLEEPNPEPPSVNTVEKIVEREVEVIVESSDEIKKFLKISLILNVILGSFFYFNIGFVGSNELLHYKVRTGSIEALDNDDYKRLKRLKNDDTLKKAKSLIKY